MSLLSRSCRVLVQRKWGSSFSYATSENAHTFCSARFTAFRTPSHPTYGFRSVVADGLQCSQLLLSSEYDNSSHASGLRAMHGITSSNSLQSGFYRDNTRKIEGFNSQGGSMIRHRFYSGGPVLWTLIGANVAVFGMWYKLDTKFMNKHFLVSIDHVFGRKLFHTLVTSAFSHYQGDHLFFNLFGLYCFGSLIEKMYGGYTLLWIYLAGAVCGSFGHMIYGMCYPWLKNIPLKSYNFRAAPAALGASGAVTTLTMLHMFLFPSNTVFLMFVPMPAALAGAIIIGVDVYRAIKGNTGISVGSHFGGVYMAACCYGALWIEGALPK